MRTLITGGNGFIGTQLARSLLAKGHTVHIMGLPVEGCTVHAHPRMTYRAGDIRSPRDVAEAMSGCSHVYHLAACARNWTRRNDDFFDINVLGTDTVLGCALTSGVERVVLTSTNLTLGPSVHGVITEETVRTTDYCNTYERSKIAAEHLASRYVLRGLPVVVVHPTRVFGPGPLNEANSVTKMILMYLQGLWRLIPGDGRAIGNYVFLRDLIDGFQLAMERGTPGEHYLLGGENVSFDDFFALLAQASGIARRMVHLPAPVAMAFAQAQQLVAATTGLHPLITPGWMNVFLADWTTSCEKAERELGYRITPLPEAFRRTIQWLHDSGQHQLAPQTV